MNRIKTYWHKSKKVAFSFLFLFVLFLTVKIFTFSSSDLEKLDKDEDYRKYIASHYKIFSLATPEGLDFAGEEVPLTDVDVHEKMDRELTINTYWHSQTLFFFKRANRWFPIIEPILKEEGVPDDFKYLALIESGFENVVSPAGASGYWQFMKQTGIGYGLEINNYVDERYHVEKSTRAACAYLKEGYRMFKSWTLVAASYNMGMGGVQTKLKEQKAKSYYDLALVQETSRYVFRILAIKEIFKNPAFYGFNLRDKDLYLPYKTYKIEVDSSIGNLADYAIKMNTNYKILKLLNPWLRDHSLPNRSRKKYTILLPEKDFPLKPIQP